MSGPMRLLASAVLVGAMVACGGDDDDRPSRASTTTAKSPARSAERPPPDEPMARRVSARDLEDVDLQGIAVAADGSVFVADIVGSRVLRIDRRGRVFDFAGEFFVYGLQGDGGHVSDAQFHGPTGLATDADGDLYVTDHGNHRIRKVDEEGTITTVVGSGPQGTTSGGFSGDGGPATEARLHEPVAVAVDEAGAIYIADRDNYRVRMVDADGTISTLAGNGESGPLGAEGQATGAALGGPVGVAAGPGKTVYIADEPAHRVYEVDTDGRMSTVAGTGAAGYRGDGGPATAAELNGPYGLAADALGNLYIADLENHVIRVVDRRGIIRTLAGTGDEGAGRDGAPATKSALSGPYAVAVDDAGVLYIADTGNGKVRRVGPSGRMTTIMP